MMPKDPRYAISEGLKMQNSTIWAIFVVKFNDALVITSQ